jgi:hypothetical protein
MRLTDRKRYEKRRKGKMETQVFSNLRSSKMPTPTPNRISNGVSIAVSVQKMLEQNLTPTTLSSEAR